jgi:hypothetical protein
MGPLVLVAVVIAGPVPGEVDLNSNSIAAVIIVGPLCAVGWRLWAR